MNENENDKLAVFFRKCYHKLFGSERQKFEKLKSMSTDELLLRYASIKAKNYINEKLSFLIVSGITLATFAGMAKFALDFIRGVVSTMGSTIEIGTNLSGGILFISVLALALVIILTIYWNGLKENKKEYYYIELILRERNMDRLIKND